MGSSSSSRSGAENSTAASATRMRQPPENSESVRFCAASSKPRPERMRAARAGAACASMSASRVWISAIRIGSLAASASRHQRVALDVGLEHEVDERLRSAGRFLLDAADAREFRDRDRAGLRLDLAADQPEQRRLAGAVAPDQPDARARRQRRGRRIDQQALADPVGEGVDVQHGGLLTRRAAAGKGRAVRKGRSSRRVMVASCRPSRTLRRHQHWRRTVASAGFRPAPAHDAPRPDSRFRGNDMEATHPNPLPRRAGGERGSQLLVAAAAL